MNLTLNLLNSKTNSDEKISINEETFWEFYYTFLNIGRKILTPSEINFLALFTVNPDMEYIIEKTKMQKSNYYTMLKRLQDKKMIEKTNDVYELHFTIKKLKEYLTKNKPSVTFTFPFEITYA